MARENDLLSRELDIYIRKHLRPEGIKLRDFFGIDAQHADGSKFIKLEVIWSCL